MKKIENKGFTLLEVLVSIVIVGLVLVCVILLSNSSTNAANVSKLNSNISYKLDSIFNEFTVDPESKLDDSRYYYDELFTTQLDERTDHYIKVDVSLIKDGGHYQTYSMTLTPYIDDKPYEIYDHTSYTRLVRIEV